MKKILILILTFYSCTAIDDTVLHCDCTETIYSLDTKATVKKLDGCYNEFEIQDFKYLDGRIKIINCE